MGKKQLLVALGGIVLVVALYLFGERVAQAGEAPAVQMGNEGAALNQEQGSENSAATSFEEILKQAKGNIPSEAQMRVTKLENNITRGDLQSQKATTFFQLAKVWDSLGQSVVAAHYKGEEGLLEKSEKTLTFAAYLLLANQEKTQDPGVRQWEIGEAQRFLENAEKLNPQSDSVQVGLAKVDVASGSVMEGVQKLMSVIEKDPDNIGANMTLGRLSITSGQFSKAIERLDKVVDRQPGNVEALYYLAEAYKNTGKKEKAIQLFNKCKELVGDPNFDKEIDNYIKTFK